MQQNKRYEIYRNVIKRVLADQESLPSLPTITLKIRQAVSDESTTIEKLVKIIGTDPALSTLLMKYASSPAFKTANKVNTLSGLVSLMGFKSVNNIVMTHSVRSLFVNRNAQLKNLYTISRNRQLVKAGYSIFLAQQLNYSPTDEVLMASFLSEVGTLALLSALEGEVQIPDAKTYFGLCKRYSKSLGIVLLTKWQIDQNLVNAVRLTGHWDNSPEGSIGLLDIVNLGLFHTVIRTSKSKITSLPKISEIAAFQKLSPAHREIDHMGQLALVSNDQREIDNLIRSMN